MQVTQTIHTPSNYSRALFKPVLVILRLLVTLRLQNLPVVSLEFPTQVKCRINSSAHTMPENAFIVDLATP